MPHFEADLTKVSVALEQFNKGDYEFLVGEPKSFQRTNNKGVETFGVRWPISLAEETDGHKKGAKQIYSGYLHTEGGQTYLKQFIMACLGFNSRNAADERRFDEQFRGADWGVDTETQGTGDMYRQVTGKRVIVQLDMGINPESGEPSQQFKGFRPITAAA